MKIFKLFIVSALLCGCCPSNVSNDANTFARMSGGYTNDDVEVWLKTQYPNLRLGLRPDGSVVWKKAPFPETLLHPNRYGNL